jgi:hypothetical protein
MISPVESSFNNLNTFIISHFHSDPSLLNEGNENSPTKIPAANPTTHPAKELFTDFISNRDLEKVNNIEQLLFMLRRKGV